MGEMEMAALKANEEGTEWTFAGLVAEVEKAVQPLGFKIGRADRDDKNLFVAGRDDGNVEITIIRKGKVG